MKDIMKNPKNQSLGVHKSPILYLPIRQPPQRTFLKYMAGLTYPHTEHTRKHTSNHACTPKYIYKHSVMGQTQKLI